MQTLRIASTLTLNYRREEVIQRLKTNLTRHKQVLAEARAGYIQKAKEAMTQKMAALDKGKIVQLRFDLRPPTSYVDAYEDVIEAMSHAEGELVELTIEQQKAFMADRWDWQNDFLRANAKYSALATSAFETFNS